MFDTLIINPILNILVALYKLLESIGLPGAFGFAIIALTTLFRLVLSPFFKQQIESQKKLNGLKPRMTELEKKYKDDKTRLQQAQLDLYKEHGINPASGCLFAIVQIPLFIGLYQTLQHFVNAANSKTAILAINKALYSKTLAITTLNPDFFFYNLAIAPQHYKLFEFSLSKGVTLFTQNLPYAHYLLVPLLTGLLQYVQAQKTLTTQPAKEEMKKTEEHKSNDKKDETSLSGDFQSAMNTQMRYFFPIMIAFFSYQLPVGLSLYWNIFSIFSIIQAIGTTKSNALANSKT